MCYTNAKDLLYELRHRPGGFDVSVGFINGREICDIDGLDIWSLECEHWLGDIVEIDGKETRVTAEIDDAELSEVSFVFDAATPGAGTHFISEERQPLVLAKAVHFYKKGKIDNEQIITMSKRLLLPDLRQIVGSRGRRDKIIFSEKGSNPSQRSQKTMETIEGLKAQVETLQEQLNDANTAKEELQTHYNTARAKQKEQRGIIRDLEARSEILEDLEDNLRTECRDLSKEAENLREKEDRMTTEGKRGI